ncbi:hypothetical protein POVWA2_040270 [Plasmodium ovale wallikeri]|uniref:Uncharacterized protein n=1 Tax=Plasmodium ovale wallikeri TaxID=864142 RepID=A0A1A8ZA53_PLAOA|nr:hypothetical protein POVWA2_040270 [Plasmodium ovale wallikeri]
MRRTSGKNVPTRINDVVFKIEVNYLLCISMLCRIVAPCCCAIPLCLSVVPCLYALPLCRAFMPFRYAIVSVCVCVRAHAYDENIILPPPCKCIQHISPSSSRKHTLLSQVNLASLRSSTESAYNAFHLPIYVTKLRTENKLLPNYFDQFSSPRRDTLFMQLVQLAYLCKCVLRCMAKEGKSANIFVPQMTGFLHPSCTPHGE